MKDLLDKDLMQTSMYNYNKQVLRPIMQDYENTYHFFNEELAHELEQVARKAGFITTIVKQHESLYLIDSTTLKFRVECKNGKWKWN